MTNITRYTRNGRFKIIHRWSDTPAYWVTSKGAEIPYSSASVVLEDVQTGKRRVCDNLDDHGFYSLHSRGRSVYLDRFQPIENLKDAFSSATYWSKGKFGTLQ